MQPQTKKRKRFGPRVKQACVACKKSHVSCEDSRPCQRCVTKNIACEDAAHQVAIPNQQQSPTNNVNIGSTQLSIFSPHFNFFCNIIKQMYLPVAVVCIFLLFIWLVAQAIIFLAIIQYCI